MSHEYITLYCISTDLIYISAVSDGLIPLIFCHYCAPFAAVCQFVVAYCNKKLIIVFSAISDAFLMEWTVDVSWP